MSKLHGVITIAMLAALSTGATAATIPVGTGQQKVQVAGTTLDVFTYRPNCRNPSLLLVFHGLHRNAPGYRDDARPVADANCMIVVAPLFDKERFPDWRYQQGGIVANREVQDSRNWTGNAVLELVSWVRQAEHRPVEYYLMGHSAGAQFLSRVAAFVPTEARRIVIANPSTHVFPTLDVAAPFGLGGVYADKDAQAQLRNYMQQPVTIFLGQDDLGDEDLSETKSAMAQGQTRYERGRNVFQEARRVAAEHHWKFNWRLVELPGVGHSARKMFTAQMVGQALRP
jgi:pimeloyl-ACP methyl ester carboxylesterase